MRTLQKPHLSSWLKRFVQLNIGLFCLGLAVVLLLDAHLGLDPWSVLHEGISHHTPLTLGQVTILVGLVILFFDNLVLKEFSGLGTILNMLLCGVWTDVCNLQPWTALFAEQGLWARLVLFLAGLLVMGLGIGLYVTANFGAGPRDSFVLGVSRISRRSVKRVRTMMEIVVLGVGILLGGTFGVGTLIFAFSMGPLMQFFLRVCGKFFVAASLPEARGGSSAAKSAASPQT